MLRDLMLMHVNQTVKISFFIHVTSNKDILFILPATCKRPRTWTTLLASTYMHFMYLKFHMYQEESDALLQCWANDKCTWQVS